MKRTLTRLSSGLALLFFLCSLVTAQAAQTAPAGTLEDLQVPAPSLAGNLLGDPEVQRVFVYLPPSYKRETMRRYPTLYLLHGFGGGPQAWITGYEGMKLPAEVDSLIAKGIAAEMIIVLPNGRNAYLGSFYTNSAVTGNWEDYVYRDVVNYVDGHYRTLAKASSRGIAGHSMGGYGAFVIAMKHPDIFGATYALSPCCIGMEGDLSGDNLVWNIAAKVTTRELFARPPRSFEDFFTVAMIATSAAFSPNKDRAPLYVDLPFIQKGMTLVRNEPAFSNFRSKMPLYQVEQYRENLMKLRGIVLDVGDHDEFTHIRRTTGMLSAEMSEREIVHAFEIYSGDHSNRIRERFSSKVMPFFTAVLENK
jgi:S-formylglutathione hydrolase FrmB